MRMRVGLLLSALASLGLAGAAGATPMSWTGTLSLQLGSLPPVVVTGSVGPGGAIVNGSSGLGQLDTLALNRSNGMLAGNGVVPLTDPLNPTLLSLRGTVALGSGTLAPIASGAASGGPLTQNTAAVQGVFKLCILFPGCSFFIPVPLTANGTRGVGIGGLITVGGFAKSGIKISINAAPWTIKTAVLTGIPTDNGGLVTSTAMGFAHGPQSLTSSTANPSGVVSLVTPVLVQTSLASNPVIALFGTLTIHLTPEPGTLLLFGAGLLGMAVFGRRRMR